MYDFLIRIGDGLDARLCNWCKYGDHGACTGVGCWGCGDPYHKRKVGVKMKLVGVGAMNGENGEDA